MLRKCRFEGQNQGCKVNLWPRTACFLNNLAKGGEGAHPAPPTQSPPHTHTQLRTGLLMLKKTQSIAALALYKVVSISLFTAFVIQLTLVILTSLISNNRLSRSENLVPA